jgi:hypothetical protein
MHDDSDNINRALAALWKLIDQQVPDEAALRSVAFRHGVSMRRLAALAADRP